MPANGGLLRIGRRSPGSEFGNVPREMADSLRRITNRGSDPAPLAPLAWKKCEDDGLIVSRLGVLDNDLGKVWQPNQPHVAVRQLRDWFAQFPYLSKLREPQVLAKAISEALARSDTKYAIADRFDEARGEYFGLRLAQLVTIDLNSDVLLVRREVADAQLAKQVPQTPSVSPGNIGRPVTGQPSTPGPLPAGPAPAARPRRFYAKVTLDPNRPTPQVSNIAQSILSELDRARGTTITLVLDMAADTVDGFSEDIENIIRDNAASLRITRPAAVRAGFGRRRTVRWWKAGAISSLPPVLRQLLLLNRRLGFFDCG